MTEQQIACPTARCPGVLRYDLAQRGDGFVAQCQPLVPWSSPNGECRRGFRWDATHEDWKRFGSRWDRWRWLGIPTDDLPWPVWPV